MINEQFTGKTSLGIDWCVYRGHTLDVMKTLPDDTSVDCIVTSPPYFWLRDYGSDNQIGHETTIAGYVESIADIFDEAYRILSPNGLVFLNIGDTYYSGKGRSHGKDPKNSKRRFGLRAVDESGGMGVGLQRKTAIGIPWRVAMEMTQRKWILRSSIIWNRVHRLAESVTDRPRRSYEFIFMFAKDRRYYFNRQPLTESDEEDIWSIPASKVNNGIDTAPFPEALVQRCLDIGCKPGGLVLDPFAGSGTTLKVALETKRPAIGIDINEEFCRYMVERITHL